MTDHVSNTELELALLDAVSEILSAYVTTNQVDQAQLPGLVAATRTALSGQSAASVAPQMAAPKATKMLAEPEAATEEMVEATVEEAPAIPAEPAVPVEASVEEDVVVCLVCGARMKTLRRHLMSAHGLDEKAYRAQYNLSKDHPLVAPSYTKRRQEVAKQIGLGAKRKKA